MLRTDTGNFNRFLTSLGLLLLAAALVIPYFYFRNTEILRVPKTELRKLTPTAAGTLRSRQEAIANLEVAVIVLSIGLAGGGATLLVLGGRRLRIAQTKEDEAVERRAYRERVEIQRLSNEEVAQKRDEQAREAVQGGEPEERLREGGGGPAAHPRRPTPPAGAQLAQSRAAIARIEETLKQILENQSFERFEYIPDVKLVHESRQIRLDGLFRSRVHELSDVLLELKLVRQSRVLRIRSSQFADAVLALLTRYKALTDRPATGWLLVVLPNEVDDLNLEERRRLEDRLNASLVDEGIGTVIHERDLKHLPQRFEELFGRRKIQRPPHRSSSGEFQLHGH